MQRTHFSDGKSTDNSLRAALLLARFGWWARYQAYRDIRSNVPIRLDGGEHSEVSTPFILELWSTARRAADQAWAALEAEQAGLRAEIARLAVAVVGTGPGETVHRRRLRCSLESWEHAALLARKRLDGTVAGLRQIQHVYWTALARSHPDLVGSAKRVAGGQQTRSTPTRQVPCPRPITCDALWPPNSLDMLTDRVLLDPRDRPPSVLEQAIEIVLQAAA
jgi:hypothetical protein